MYCPMIHFHPSSSFDAEAKAAAADAALAAAGHCKFREQHRALLPRPLNADKNDGGGQSNTDCLCESEAGGQNDEQIDARAPLLLLPPPHKQGARKARAARMEIIIILLQGWHLPPANDSRWPSCD